MESMSKENLIKVVQGLRMPHTPSIKQMVRFALRLGTSYGRAVGAWEVYELWRYTYAHTQGEKQSAARKKSEPKKYRCLDCGDPITRGALRCHSCASRAKVGKPRSGKLTNK